MIIAFAVPTFLELYMPLHESTCEDYNLVSGGQTLKREILEIIYNGSFI